MTGPRLRRLLPRLISEKAVLLVASLGVSLLMIKLAYVSQACSGDTLRPSLQALSQDHYRLNLSRPEKKSSGHENVPCPNIDFFLASDKSAINYSPDLLCDEFAAKSDIVCRMYFRQVGLDHLEKGSCALKNPNKVPKVVYFVIFGTYVFKFWHYVSIMAAKRYIKPSAVYVIGDQHPMGRWWQQVLRDVHGVRFVYRELPPNISGEPVHFQHHLSDLVRLQTLYFNGGIYLDADMVVVRDLEPLLDYDITLGMVENGTGMGNAFIVAKRGSPFIREWYNEYRHYKKDEFYWNSLQIPRNMWFQNSSRVHIESERLYRPNWFEADLLFKREDYPWKNNYAVHVWTNGNPVPKSPMEIQTKNTTIAQIFRHVLYGDSRPRNSSDMSILKL